MAAYEVLEASCIAKEVSEKTRPGEDVLVLGEHFAAVLDGAGSWSGWLAGHTPGRFAALCTQEALAQLNPQATAFEAVQWLSARLREAVAGAPVSGELLRPATCAAAIYSATRREVWLLADCQALIGARHYQYPLPTDERATALRQVYLQALLLRGAKVEELRAADPSWPLLRPLFEAAPAFQNHPTHRYGYSALDGQDVPAAHLHVIALPPGEQEVVLASDGYPELHPTLALSEAALWELAQTDPLMIGRSPGTRSFPSSGGSFDDRTYLRLRCL